MQTCGAENGRFVTEAEIFQFFQKRQNSLFLMSSKWVKKMEDQSFWAGIKWPAASAIARKQGEGDESFPGSLEVTVNATLVLGPF